MFSRLPSDRNYCFSRCILRSRFIGGISGVWKISERSRLLNEIIDMNIKIMSKELAKIPVREQVREEKFRRRNFRVTMIRGSNPVRNPITGSLISAMPDPKIGERLPEVQIIPASTLRSFFTRTHAWRRQETCERENGETKGEIGNSPIGAESPT